MTKEINKSIDKTFKKFHTEMDEYIDRNAFVLMQKLISKIKADLKKKVLQEN